VQKLFTREVGVVETLLAFDLLIRSRVAHKNTVLLSRQAIKHACDMMLHLRLFRLKQSIFNAEIK